MASALTFLRGTASTYLDAMSTVVSRYSFPTMSTGMVVEGSSRWGTLTRGPA